MPLKSVVAVELKLIVLLLLAVVLLVYCTVDA